MQLRLKDLIAILTAAHRENPNHVMVYGFSNPHSYRGYYEELAFEPESRVPIGTLLDTAQSAQGQTYAGWKGGEYTMTLNTPVNISREGRTHDDPNFSGLADTLAELACVFAAVNP